MIATRVGYSCGLAIILVLAGAKGLQNAAAEGDTRTISMHHIHTDEDITITYKRDGVYDEAALEKLNWFLRDWRREQQIRMDPHLIDLVWEVQRETGSKEPIRVVCGYRSPETNAMLRRRSRGVARFSQHMLGHAMDFYIPGVPLDQLRAIGLRLQRGGVGFYPTSGSPFVHMDTGGIRMWPRMTRDQLLHVFPDGRTVHIPSDGRPLPGYALALADVRKRGNDPSQMSIDAARSAGVNVAAAGPEHPIRTAFAKLFGLRKHDPDEDEDATAAVASAVAPAPVAPLRVRAKAAVVAAIEHAEGKLVAAEKKTKQAVATVHFVRRAEAAPGAPTPNEIVVARGFWQGVPDGMIAAQPAAAAASALITIARPNGSEPGNSGPAVAGATDSFAAAHDDRVPAELALAYAQQPTREGRPRVVASATSIAVPSRAAAPRVTGLQTGVAAMTIAVKGINGEPASIIAAGAADAAPAYDRDAVPINDPWLRAIALSPSVRSFLTTTALGVRDLRTLASWMVKPNHSVMMTFSADPVLGLADDHFSGSAVVFVSTVSYPTNSASLQ